MDEQAIQDRLKANIPMAEPPTPPQVGIVDSETDGHQALNVDYKLDELVQYKLHDFFGMTYKPNNEISKQQAEYIYNKVSGMVDNQEYGFVVAKIRELERIIGTANSSDRMYRLYQWLKLDSMRRNIEAEMGSVIYG